MTNTIEGSLHRLGTRLPGLMSKPGDERYDAAKALWAKPVGRMPRAIAHCRTSEDVQAVVRTARDIDLPLSVRGGGHDWAGRALCGGIVIDLSAMNGVCVCADSRSAQILGGARASDVLAVTDPLGLAAVTGTCGPLGMAGLTMGGGYGNLIGRFGLALDNLLAAEVVLADGRKVLADQANEVELFWALRGGGGNFGVVTAMQHRLHDLPSVHSGLLLYPSAEARSVLENCVEIAACMPEELTVQFGFIAGPDGSPLVLIVPMWSGLPQHGEARVAPFIELGTLIAGTVESMPYGASLAAVDPFIVNGQRAFVETCWLPAFDRGSIDLFVEAMATAVSPGCLMITHEFRGAASLVPVEATAFGLRRDHVLVEIIALFDDSSAGSEEQRHWQWARATRQAFDAMALPGGYPNFLDRGDTDRAAKAYAGNAGRLLEAKRQYDPDNIFSSATPLPAGQHKAPAI